MTVEKEEEHQAFWSLSLFRSSSIVWLSCSIVLSKTVVLVVVAFLLMFVPVSSSLGSSSLSNSSASVCSVLRSYFVGMCPCVGVLPIRSVQWFSGIDVSGIVFPIVWNLFRK